MIGLFHGFATAVLDEFAMSEHDSFKRPFEYFIDLAPGEINPNELPDAPHVR